MKLRLKPINRDALWGIVVVLAVLGSHYIPQAYDDYKFNRKIQEINKIGTDITNAPVPDYEKNAFLNVSPDKIKPGDSVSFTYGYIDKTNNEHLSTATTTLSVETPSKRNFKAMNAKNYPSDFNGANTYEQGFYIVDVERKIKKTDGTEEILYRQLGGFFVE